MERVYWILAFGPIYSVHIPIANVEEGKKPKARGFAFIWFFSKKDAERAIEGVNGKAVVAGAISAPTMNKKERARLRRKLRESQGKTKEEDAEDSDDEGSKPDGHSEPQNTNERIVAVDWALSKDKWEDAKALGGGDDEKVEGSEGSDSDEQAEEDSAVSGSEASGYCLLPRKGRRSSFETCLLTQLKTTCEHCKNVVFFVYSMRLTYFL